jgi:hypothetical protein
LHEEFAASGDVGNGSMHEEVGVAREASVAARVRGSLREEFGDTGGAAGGAVAGGGDVESGYMDERDEAGSSADGVAASGVVSGAMDELEHEGVVSDPGRGDDSGGMNERASMREGGRSGHTDSTEYSAPTVEVLAALDELEEVLSEAASSPFFVDTRPFPPAPPPIIAASINPADSRPVDEGRPTEAGFAGSIAGAEVLQRPPLPPPLEEPSPEVEVVDITVDVYELPPPPPVPPCAKARPHHFEVPPKPPAVPGEEVYEVEGMMVSKGSGKGYDEYETRSWFGTEWDRNDDEWHEPEWESSTWNGSGWGASSTYERSESRSWWRHGPY